MRKAIKGLTAASMAALLTVPAFAGFVDDRESTWYAGCETPVTSALPLSRAEVGSIKDFSDYNSAIKGHWGESQIDALFMAGGINGTPDGNGGVKFDPDRSITTAELLSLILEAGNKVDDTKAWPARVIDPAIELGIIPSSMSSEANTPITREKMAMVLVNSAKAIRNEDTTGITFDASKIGDLNQADSTYRSYIQTAYGMGLLEGSGKGYKP